MRQKTKFNILEIPVIGIGCGPMNGRYIHRLQKNHIGWPLINAIAWWCV